MTTRYTNTNILLRMILAATAVMMLWSCSTFPEDEMYIGHSSDGRPTNGSQGGRDSGTHRNKVFIVYSMGFNNLSYDLNEDINDLLSSDIPSFRQDDDAILVLNHSTLNNSSNYKVETSPALYHAYKMNDGSIKRDTLITFPEGSVAATKEMLSEVLNFVKEKFPANHYGMLVSSHATGWTPEMYCYNPPDKSPAGGWKAREKDFVPLDKYLDDRPLTKSIGAHFHGSSANMDEIDLTDFAAAIPFHLDFLVFDCCLMGGVEVAYELREKCDKICFSQTEILAGGMDYTTMISHIFDNEEVNMNGIAFDYYIKYAMEESEVNRSATISVVDCRKLEPLAEIIRRNKDAIDALAQSTTRNRVQKYFRSSYSRNHGMFFDLEDILIKSTAPDSELQALETALEDCIVCKYATPSFLTSLRIDNHSGLSMYLPDPSRRTLNQHYTTLAWNKATGLITDIE
jgi:hypothetical protein